eukprot:NODE_9959_length_300_cov_96.338645_g8191_i0.p3 GENE.NODE_9959_length_300_cov_96.338645_g8191_i0~~NODE_9959_length_300_cov_96.338645_g8191_i0.p3  ORF type:complete len:88 (-),score=35.47 NODE_9959_length_300_cov_96.338645_g8191_i0:36-269(-)
MGGDRRPSISDLEVYGALQAVRNTSLETTILEQTNTAFHAWYTAMRKEVYGESATADAIYSNKIHFLLPASDALVNI